MKVPYVDLGNQHQQLESELLGAVRRVLDHGSFILGPEVATLEKRLTESLGVADAITCNSGTDALVMALKHLAIGAGDEVITTSHSFAATANAIVSVGATPVFADIDDETMTLDADSVATKLTSRTRAIMPVHLNGFACDLSAMELLASAHNLRIIEDCAQAFGTTRKGVSVGARHLGCFSLHPLKILSACGDGGFLTVPDPSIASELRSMRNHGLLDRDHLGSVGINSRLDSLQAAIVLVKLEVVRDWIERRRRHAEIYREGLEGVLRLPPKDPDVVQTFSAFVVRHPKRDALVKQLHARGVDAKIHYPLAIHQQKPYLGAAGLPVTETVVSEIISLPIAEHLTEAQLHYSVDQVIEATKEVGP